MLEVGSIVTVVSVDWLGYGHQAHIVEVDATKEEPYRLAFGKWASHLFGFQYEQNKASHWYPESALRVDTEITVQNEVEEVFSPHMAAYHIHYPSFPLDPEQECMVEGCREKCARRILYNCWGTVIRYYTCSPHADQYHGVCGDGFPMDPLWKRPVLVAA